MISLICKMENNKKTRKKAKWKLQNIICDDFEKQYQEYIECKNCQKCNVVLTTGGCNKSNTKCIDHDHLITDKPNVRGIICNRCNRQNILDTHPNKNNKIGIKNIRNRGSCFEFRISRLNIQHSKRFKTLEEAIIYKNEYIKNNL